MGITEYNKSIYKLDSKGKVRILTVSSNKGELIQTSGILGGKLVEHKSLCAPKNIGKSNETTAEEQAIQEAKALINIKLAEGYSNSIEEAKTDVVILPMLAKSYEDEKEKIDWSSAFVQPKLDGMRMLENNGVKISRKNKEIDTVNHIIINRPALLNCYVDGELYIHGENFQENMRLIKKYRAGLTENVKYHIYDVISELPFIDRHYLAQSIVQNSKNCVLVETYAVNNMEEVKKYHTKFLSEGYEGTMIRWGLEGYKVNGRSSNLLKYKDFIDISCKVVGVIPSEKNPEQGVIHCEYNNKTFGCGMKFSHEEREEILKNKEKYIGKVAEIRFFEFSEDGVPRFPVCVGFRLDI